MSSYIEGTNRITVDIVDRDENKIGPGPIGTCLGVEYTAVLNDAGTWSARFPANDPMLSRVQIKAHFLHFYVDGEIFCYGLVEKSDWELSNDGQQILVLGGRDSLAELDEYSIKQSDTGVLVPLSLFIAYNAEYNPNWTISNHQTTTSVYSSFDGESTLRALIRVAEHTGESFRLGQRQPVPLDVFGSEQDPKRHVEWLSTGSAPSGVRAVGTAGEPIDAENNEFICFIQNLTERRDASRMFNKIHPIGSGLGETALDIVFNETLMPDGFSLNWADNSITNLDSVENIGRIISRRVLFKDIRPLFNTDADILAAQNYLVAAALAYLQRNDDEDDTLEYDLDVIKLPWHVKVGMTLRVVWQDEIRTIDRDMIILAIRMVVGSNGEITYGLTVATQNQWRFRETNNIVAQLEEGQIFTSHPQIDAGAYWKPYKELVGDDQIDGMAEFPFFLSAEVVTIRQVLFRFKVEQPLIAVKSFSFAAPSVQNNDASATGGTAAVIDSTAVTTASTAVTTASTAVTTASTAVTAASVSPNTGDASVTVNTTGSTGISTPSPGSLTDTNYLGLATATQPPVGGDTSPTHHHDIGTHAHEFFHTHILATEHGHTSVAHSHTTVAHTHTSTAHTHTSTAHTHTSTAHTHTSTAHTHTSAAHTHTETQHVHLLPDLEESYSVERISALSTYAIADLEYAVNGGLWVGLDTAIPSTGGYDEVDITSEVQNPAGLKRPYQEYNVVQVRRTTAAGTGKLAQIRVELGIRQTIQSIVLYE